MKNKNLDSIDLLKVILSIAVIAIHVNPFGRFGEIIFPICRIAVPIFFIISSYFLFNKLSNSSNPKEVIINFIKRNLKLYLFWFIVLLPITFMTREYYNYGFIEAIRKILIDFLLSSTFIASWYIMALLQSVLIVYILSKKIPDKVLLAFSMIIYLVCCLFSNYQNLLYGSSVLEFYNNNISPNIAIWNSFLVRISMDCNRQNVCKYSS